MLANGAKLGYKKKGAGEDYTNLTGLKEIPELGDDPEKVENTGLADKVKQYDLVLEMPEILHTNSSMRTPLQPLHIE